MKKSIILILFFGMILLVSCMTSSFVSTGDYHEPLPENTYVKVVVDNDRNLDYDEIGLIEVEEEFGNPNLAQIIEKAKIEARDRGSDCIILLSNTTKVEGNAEVVTSKMYYLFKAVKLRNS